MTWKYSKFFNAVGVSKIAALGRPLSGFGLLLLLLLATSLRAQTLPGTKPAMPATPSAAGMGYDTAAHAAPQVTRSGVRFVVQERGTGPLAQRGSRVAIQYTGFLPDGHVFDASAAAGGPLRFRVGRGEVIRGWDELLVLLPAGSRVRAWVPAKLAYGAAGVRDPDNAARFLIPPNTELMFELYVVSVR